MRVRNRPHEDDASSSIHARAGCMTGEMSNATSQNSSFSSGAEQQQEAHPAKHNEVDYDALERAVQEEANRVIPPVARVALRWTPEVTDDYIRNFLLRNGMHQTLECFEVEWYERFGSAANPNIPLIADNYLETAALLNRIEVLEQDLQRHAELTTKVTKQWAQARRDRDLHRASHNRLVQEKHRLDALLRQARQHSEAMEPAMQELRQRCDQLLKTKTLLTMDRDKWQQRVVELESSTSKMSASGGNRAPHLANNENAADANVPKNGTLGGAATVQRLRKGGDATAAARAKSGNTVAAAASASKKTRENATAAKEAVSDDFVWPADKRRRSSTDYAHPSAAVTDNATAHESGTNIVSVEAAAAAIIHANHLATDSHTLYNAHEQGNDPMQWVQRYHFVAHSMSVSTLAMHPRKPAVATGSDDGSWQLSALPHGDVIASSAAAVIVHEQCKNNKSNDPSGNDMNHSYGHTNWIAGLAMHPHGTMLATGSGDKTVRLWDFSQTRSALTMTGHTDGVWDVDFQDTGVLLASAGLDTTARVWDVHRGQCRQILRGHTDAVNSVRWQPGSNLLCTASADKTVSLWDARLNRCVETLYGHRNAVLCAETTTQSGLLIASCDAEGVVMLWDVRTMRARVRHICSSQTGKEGTAVAASQVAIDATERYLAVACDDGMIRLIDTQAALDSDGRNNISYSTSSAACGQTPCAVVELMGHEDAVQCVAFDPATNGFLISGGDDRTVRYWQ